MAGQSDEPETWDFTEFLEHVGRPPIPTKGPRTSSVTDAPERAEDIGPWWSRQGGPATAGPKGEFQ